MEAGGRSERAHHSSCRFYSVFFFSSRRRHTRFDCDWSSDVCSSDLAQNSANRRNSLLPGTPERQAQNAPRLGTTAEEVTPADHMIALAIGVAFCIEAFSVCTPKKGRCSNNHRSPAGQPSGLPVPPTV